MSIMVCRMRTVPMPRIITRLEERLPDGGVLPLGEADLTYAAAVDIDAGRRWDTDLVPATVEVCKAISHPARVAAWEGRLHAPGLARQFAALETHALAQGPGAFSFGLSVCIAARQVARHAEWLARTAAAAQALPWPSEGYVAHPLTGEAVPASRRHSIEAPFAFAAEGRPFIGIDARGLADFLADGGGGVSEFLACTVRHPEAWFTGLRDLEEAALGYSMDGGFDALEAAVAGWNAVQRVFAITPVHSAIHVGPAKGHADAVAWAQAYAAKARALARAVRTQVPLGAGKDSS